MTKYLWLMIDRICIQMQWISNWTLHLNFAQHFNLHILRHIWCQNALGAKVFSHFHHLWKVEFLGKIIVKSPPLCRIFVKSFYYMWPWKKVQSVKNEISRVVCGVPPPLMWYLIFMEIIIIQSSENTVCALLKREPALFVQAAYTHLSFWKTYLQFYNGFEIFKATIRNVI